MGKALEIENLNYTYRGDWGVNKKEALNNITLSLEEGEAFGFLGHNGAGKTTTIKCILGLVKPSTGKINLFGTDSSSLKARAQIGYLPEQPYFYDYLSVEETLHMFASLAEVELTAINNRIDKVLSRVHLNDKRKIKMRALSKGLTQRVAMAQALIGNPKLLILDEPFSGLDPIGRREFRELILEERSFGTTIFMSTHVLSDVEAICDRASIMVNGELKGVFELQSLSKSRPGVFELVIDSALDSKDAICELAREIMVEKLNSRLLFESRDKSEQALKLCLERQIPISSYEFNHGSLEDLFVALIAESKGASHAK